MATNADIIALALKIADLDKRAARYRALAGASSATVGESLMQDAASVDADIARLCAEMRLACYSPSEADKVIASLPDCVAAAMLGDEDETDAWTDKEIL